MTTKRNLFQLCLLAAVLLPAVAQAQFTFTTNNGAITITGYSGPGGAVVIPDATNGYSVTSIGNDAFAGSSITDITIADSIVSIGARVFSVCTNLADVTMGASVASIGDRAFEDSGLTSIKIPNSVTNLGQFTFWGCNNLTNATIGSNVTTIGFLTFAGCASLTNVTLPDNLVTIGPDAFDQCVSLPSVYIPKHVTSIGGFAFYGCSSLTNITIGDNVTTIANDAFACCSNLTSVTFPASVTSLGSYVFQTCSNLHMVYFRGNSPSANSTIFSDDPTAIVYYLPWTIGWNETFGGAPTLSWNPQAQTSDPNFGVRMNGFSFNITGTTNIPVVIEACTDLGSSTWIPLQSVSLTNGSFYFSDSQWTNYPGRFYRLRSP